jgi:ABC-type enterochelin transport system ATPase subunit
MCNSTKFLSQSRRKINHFRDGTILKHSVFFFLILYLLDNVSTGWNRRSVIYVTISSSTQSVLLRYNAVSEDNRISEKKTTKLSLRTRKQIAIIMTLLKKTCIINHHNHASCYDDHVSSKITECKEPGYINTTDTKEIKPPPTSVVSLPLFPPPSKRKKLKTKQAQYCCHNIPMF